jgi:C-terminal processing protease CtpA/Prc
VEILPRNIGYVKLDGFAPVNLCALTVVAAMNFVANVDAIIFDLRDNRGGDALGHAGHDAHRNLYSKDGAARHTVCAG